MRIPPQAHVLESGRLHLQHGPIDLIVTAFGERNATRAAYGAAFRRFATILNQLCGELAILRAPASAHGPDPAGPVARRMTAAVRPFAAGCFITPMAAVAGSVADEILAAMTRSAPLRRAYVNNGGDIAVHLASGESVRIGLVDRPDRPGFFGETRIEAGQGVGGIATSGWRGRSFSLGIADAVTILAETAAEADAAATVVANAVNIPDHPAVHRVPASEVQADSDLGDRLVTRAVGELASSEIDLALARGLRVAEDLVRQGRMVGAALHCQGRTRVAGSQGERRPDPARMRALG